MNPAAPEPANHRILERLRGTGILMAAALGVTVLRLSDMHLEPWLEAIVFGLGIVACAFLMGTAAELVQLDVPRSVAVILVALLAVLPEYAVDIYFAWMAGKDPAYASYALANMVGANRLLVGLGWPVIAFLWWRRSRRTHIELEPANGGEVIFLGLATAWSFTIPFRASLSLVDAAVLFALFLLYLRFARAQPQEDPELVGPAELIAKLPLPRRRAATISLFVVAGAGIFASSEPFAEGLLASGQVLGISEYHLVQWLAPLASESPEFLVAGLLVWRMNPVAGFGTLLSSKVNQWTLLVGAVPVAFALSATLNSGFRGALPLDDHQAGEILLTAAQSYAGVCMLLNRRFHLGEAILLLVPFVLQLAFSIWLEEAKPANHDLWLRREKIGFSVFYMVIGTAYFLAYRRHVRGLFTVAFPRRRR